MDLVNLQQEGAFVMRRSLVSALAALAVMALSTSAAGEESPSHRWIVRFREPAVARTADGPAAVIRNLQGELDADLGRVTAPFRGLGPIEKLWAARAIAVTATPEQARRLAALSHVEEVRPVRSRKWLEDCASEDPAQVRGEPQWGVAKIRAPEVWEKYKIDGSGVLVGHIDSGVDARHPLLAGKILTFKDFTKKPSGACTDELGHGTHVAGTICAGNGVGVAPGARLIVAKIFDAQGSADDESVIKAMQWIMDPDGNPNTNDFPRIINNSWGDSPTDENDPASAMLFRTVKSWVAIGILPIFTAGNKGPTGSVGRPGCFPNTWAVGSTNGSDWGSPFSSVGPSTWMGQTYIKPDVAAPGAGIISCKANSAALEAQSGTSMACPHVTGLAALMLQANPLLSADEIRRKAEATVIDLGTPGKDNKFGMGRIDAFACLSSIVSQTPVSNLVEGFRSALETERALTGNGIGSPLAGSMAGYVRERGRELDTGAFSSLRATFSGDSAATAILEEMAVVQRFESLHRER